MKIIIIGATGTVGRELVKQALEKCYHVTAFVRNPEKLATLKHDRLSVFKGDIENLKDVEKAVPHHDAVLCVLGDGRIGKIRAVGTKNIIDVMNRTGVRRLMCQSTLGVGESFGNLNFVWKHIMFGMLLKKSFRDHQLQEEYVEKSGLDYTIVRPSALTDGVITNTYKTGFDGQYKKLTLKISRSDVADFMLRQLKEDRYVKSAVSISN